MKFVVCGSISIKTLWTESERLLQRLITLNATVLVGDAGGFDRAAQAFLHRAGYRDVIVYHRAAGVRNNLGGWPTIAVQGSYTDRDRRMCGDADWGIAGWDGRSPGTKRNIEQLGKRMRVVQPA